MFVFLFVFLYLYNNVEACCGRERWRKGRKGRGNEVNVIFNDISTIMYGYVVSEEIEKGGKREAEGGLGGGGGPDIVHCNIGVGASI